LLARTDALRLAAGGSTTLPITPETARLLHQGARFAATVPGKPHTLALATDHERERFFIAATPTMPAGVYRVSLSLTDPKSEESADTILVTVDPLPTVQQTTRVPVVLVRGWNGSSFCAADSTETFGQLQRFLEADGAPTVFFDNCRYGNVPIEDLGA